MIGCGIFRREIDFLIAQNGWNLATEFLDSSLHVNLKALGHQLTEQLQRHQSRQPIVFYGCCHPLMEQMLEHAATFRTEGQNCVEMLLGTTRFEAELAAGAFFLLEPWARNWNDVVTRTFGHKWDITRAIFHEDRKYVLGIRTPLSGDFSADAEAAATSIDMPLRWMDTGLEHLETVLIAALRHRQQQEQQQQ